MDTKIAIIGFGTVGSGVAEVFYKNRPAIERKAGAGSTSSTS